MSLLSDGKKGENTVRIRGSKKRTAAGISTIAMNDGGGADKGTSIKKIGSDDGG